MFSWPVSRFALVYAAPTDPWNGTTGKSFSVLATPAAICHIHNTCQLRTSQLAGSIVATPQNCYSSASTAHGLSCPRSLRRVPTCKISLRQCGHQLAAAFRAPCRRYFSSPVRAHHIQVACVHRPPLCCAISSRHLHYRYRHSSSTLPWLLSPLLRPLCSRASTRGRSARSGRLLARGVAGGGAAR